jgi:hypothetical protein
VAVLVSFSHCDKMPEKNQLFILAHGLRDFTPWLVGSFALRPVAKAELWQKGVQRKASWQPESQERGRVQRQDTLFKSMPPGTYFL